MCLQRDLTQHFPKIGAGSAAGDPGRPWNPGWTLNHVHEAHLADTSHLQVRIQEPGSFHEYFQNHGGGNKRIPDELERSVISDPKILLLRK
jgi:hypothetical protein